MNVNAKLMRAAGFRPVRGSKDTWERGDIRVLIGDSVRVSLKRLIGYVISQSVYLARNRTTIKYEGFQKENKP